jgi:hypothetical protein
MVDAGRHRPNSVADANQGRASLQEFKQKNVKLENLKVAKGGVAAYGRRVIADIQVRFADGTMMYEGPYVYEFGFLMCGGFQSHTGAISRAWHMAWLERRGIRREA